MPGIKKTEDDEKDKVLRWMKSVGINWADLPDEVAPILEALARDASAQAMVQMDVTEETSVNLSNKRSVEWAQDRAAEMVGMKWVDGRLTDNPDAQWAINETTREAIADLVTQAIDDGWSNDRLSSAISDSGQFSASRADMIARTETAVADVQGNMVAYKTAQESGIDLQKEWITAGDDLVSEDCQLNADAGPIDLDGVFPSGASAPPEHPNCRCDVLPVRIFSDLMAED